MTMINSASMKTKTIPAGAFKARCLAIMDEVQAKRQAVVITKRGKPVAKLVPVGQEKDDIFGFFKGKGSIEIKGDIVSPVLTPEEWGDLF
jgi:prevent-host-death family protein